MGIKLRTETLWNIFRMREIGKKGLSEMEVNELKMLLEEKGDSGKLDVIDKAINNYKNRIKPEILWNIFRMRGIGKEGLSETKAYELKILLEKGDDGRSGAINKAINNYKIRMERIEMEELNEKNQNDKLEVISSNKINWKYVYKYM